MIIGLDCVVILSLRRIHMNSLSLLSHWILHIRSEWRTIYQETDAISLYTNYEYAFQNRKFIQTNRSFPLWREWVDFIYYYPMTILTPPQIYAFLDTVSGEWTYEKNMLLCCYEFESFLEAVWFVNDLTEVVEKMGHHPDILIQYNKVTLSTTTHDAEKQITDLDTSLVEEIEQLLD